MWKAKNSADQAALDKQINKFKGLVARLDSDNENEGVVALKAALKCRDRINLYLGSMPGGKRPVWLL